MTHLKRLPSGPLRHFAQSRCEAEFTVQMRAGLEEFSSERKGSRVPAPDRGIRPFRCTTRRVRVALQRVVSRARRSRRVPVAVRQSRARCTNRCEVPQADTQHTQRRCTQPAERAAQPRSGRAQSTSLQRASAELFFAAPTMGPRAHAERERTADRIWADEDGLRASSIA